MFITSLPKELLLKIEFNTATACSLREVSKFFLTLIDESEIWKKMCFKQKGDHFTAEKAIEWRNFLSLDKDLAKVFYRAITKNQISDVRKNATFLSLVNLDKGIIKVYFDNRASYYLRLSPEAIQTLKTKNCKDYQSWKESIEKIIDGYMSSPWPFQNSGNFANRPNVLKNLEEKWEKPDKKMSALIKKHNITDVFIFDNGDTAITASNTLTPTLLQRALLEGEELNDVENFDLYKGCMDMCHLTGNPFNNFYCQILVRLADEKTGMRKFLTEMTKSRPEIKTYFGL